MLALPFRRVLSALSSVSQSASLPNDFLRVFPPSLAGKEFLGDRLGSSDSEIPELELLIPFILLIAFGIRFLPMTGFLS